MTKPARLLVLTIVATFLALRMSLVISPDSDFNVAGYNVHHLFTGVLVMFAGGAALALGARGRIALVTFGIGAGLTLDEVVYLIATDGTNASYLNRVSWIGGIVTVALALLYIIILDRHIGGKRE
jgi:hypothetical protein